MSEYLSTSPEERRQPDTVDYERVPPRCKSGRYVARKFHARGGMGEVWLADDEDIGRPVALKRLRLERLDQKERFMIEAQITGQLEHPGIVPVHDVGTDVDNQPFYIMSFVGGHTLKEAIADYHAPDSAGQEPKQVQRLRLLEAFVRLCQTIGYAHSRGVIHRDLKPENVMLGPYGETVVLDWGVAKVKSSGDESAPANYVHLTYGTSSTATQYGTVMGTPSYMAPEQAEGKATEADERTDVYLLGGTLYTILTGRTPRQGGSLEAMIELACTVSPVPPRKLNPQVPRALDAICMRALAQRKQDRYASAAELATEVQRYVAGEPVAAYPEWLPARAWRWCKRHQRALGRSAAAALLLGLAAFGLVLWQKHREVVKRDEARAQVAEFRDLADNLYYQAAPVEAVDDKQNPYYDPERAQATGKRLLDLIDGWRDGVDGLPLPPEERAAVKEELYAVLLLLAQVQPSEGQKLLARAATLQGSAGGLHDAALDHFLNGEKHRLKGMRLQAGPTEELTWQPDRAELTDAVKEYRAALLLRPKYYWACYQLGQCLLSLGQRDEAISALGACVALRPEAPWGWSARGLAQDKPRDAEHDFDKALELNPFFIPAKLNRATMYHKQKEYGKALFDLNDLQLPEGHYYRGLVLLEQDRYAEALAAFDKVNTRQSEFRHVNLPRARACFALEGKDQEGLMALNTYLMIRPIDIELPESYEKRGRLLRLLMARETEGSEAWKHLGNLALEQLHAASEKGGESAGLFSELGSMLQFQEGGWKKAFAYYEKGLKLEPNHSQLHIKRGILALGWKKDLKQARADFEAAERSDNDRDRVEALTWLGILQVREKAGTGALDTAARALLYVPDKGGRPDFFVVHQVARIFAELAEAEPATKRQREDICLEHLQREIALARLADMENKAKELIEGELSFRALKKSRAEDWKKVLAGGTASKAQ
jgi:tetratricopeptide (TPR) repeat protein/tRNA A-37 threonylcarbamoyl transferase component Bud32